MTTRADIPAADLAQIKHEADLLRRIRDNKYIPFTPTAKQGLALLDERREVLFGGAAGPGKSFWLLMAALLYVDESQYRALLLRRTFSDLKLPGALIDLADTWLGPTDAHRGSGGLEWTFPSGASLNFGYLANEAHKFRYASSAFHFVGFDELTQFSQTQYEFLFSRVRRPLRDTIPLRIRSASNPGGVGADWVKGKFLKVRNPDRLFVPARMSDNEHLDVPAYRAMLREMDPVTRRQMEHGDWEVAAAGNIFATDSLQVMDEHESPVDWAHPRIQRVRAWDMAATAKDSADYCAGVRVAYDPLSKRYAIEDVVRVRQEPGIVEQTLRRTAQSDPRGMTQVIEQEPGSAGKIAIRHFRTTAFDGHPVQQIRPSKDKVTRARLAASAIAGGDVEVRPEVWMNNFLNELRAFPQDGIHDDQVDALSHAFQALAMQRGALPPVAPNSVTMPSGPRSAQARARIDRTAAGGGGRRVGI